MLKTHCAVWKVSEVDLVCDGLIANLLLAAGREELDRVKKLGGMHSMASLFDALKSKIFKIIILLNFEKRGNEFALNSIKLREFTIFLIQISH